MPNPISTWAQKQMEDASKAMKDYMRNKDNPAPGSNVSVHGAAKAAYQRNQQTKNALDQLDEDMKNAGRSSTDKQIYGK
jgi:benzoyl-CoA reductase/2-hydroxyglutaryl-CoA dehydratase subunit BcrC/BadD/HgdB